MPQTIKTDIYSFCKICWNTLVKTSLSQFSESYLIHQRNTSASHPCSNRTERVHPKSWHIHSWNEDNNKNLHEKAFRWTERSLSCERRKDAENRQLTMYAYVLCICVGLYIFCGKSVVYSFNKWQHSHALNGVCLRSLLECICVIGWSVYCKPSKYISTNIHYQRKTKYSACGCAKQIQAFESTPQFSPIFFFIHAIYTLRYATR